MRLVFLYLFTISCSSIFAQSSGNAIVIGNYDSIYSNILKEQRKIWVYVPQSNTGIFFKQQYPVVYLLDGDAHFHSVTGIIQQLSTNGNSVLPEMIVVGITNTDRMRDLTPTPTKTGIPLNNLSINTSGGGELFTQFIEKELIPHIDSFYPTAPYRLLIGHSLGGLMAVNTLIHHPDLFNAYLAIDPSMWWDDKKLLKQTEQELSNKKFNGKSLFLAMANTLKPNLDTSQLRKDTSATSIHMRSILQLADALGKSKQNELRWNWKYYKDDDHGSVPLIAEYDAFRFIFGFYKFTLPTPDLLNSIDIDSALTAHYKIVSEKMAYRVSPPEMVVNNLGYYFLQQKNMDKAKQMFELNIKNYPKSFNTYDSMGDFYDAAGDTQMAKVFYHKALQIHEFPETKLKLDHLNSGK